MATSLKLRRGTTSQHASFTGSAADVTVDTDKNTVVVHDGSTAGGFPLAKQVNPTLSGNVTTTGLNFDSNTFVIDATNNRVGVGTASPANTLDVTGAANSVQARFGATAGRGLEISVIPFGATVNATSVLNALGASNGTLVFQTESSERMRITSAGNVGIGTSSPSYKLDVYGAVSLGNPTTSGVAVQHFIRTGGGVTGNTTNGLTFKPTTAASVDQYARFETGSGVLVGAYGAVGDNLRIATRTDATAVVISQAGNLGLGVTPSAWFSDYRVMQLGLAGAVFNDNFNEDFNVSSNAFADTRGGYKYIRTGHAQRYVQANGGGHRWFNSATSGTAGNAITFTQAMTLDASGRLLLGTTSARTNLFGSASSKLQTEGTSGDASRISIIRNANTDLTNGGSIVLAASKGTVVGSNTVVAQNTKLGFLTFAGADGTNIIEAASIFGAVDGTPGTNDMPGRLVFATTADGASSATERMRIDSSGNLLVGTTAALNSGKVTVRTPTSFTGSGFRSDSETAAGTGWNHFYGTSSTNSVANIIIYGNGNIINANNSYGAISDIKLKENIVDATPKLEKLNQVRVVNYNLIGEEQKQIGVVAQELEGIFPSMIEESPDKDAEGNDLGTTTKSVKYSVFVPMLIKAIQEQQAIINDLKARIETLESK